MPVPRKSGNHPALARILGIVSACAVVAVFAGCGSSDEKFTSGESSRALAALDAIQEFVEQGRCEAARKRSNALAIQSTHVNDDRPDLGEAYASSVARLQVLIARECVEIAPEGPTVDVTPATGSTGGETPVEPTAPAGGGGTDNGGDGGGGGGAPDNGGQNGGDGGGGGDTTPPDNSGGAAPGA